ncbi:hypothetical protein [Ruthenibacterium lactatiformans]|uniref:hypothetical protein n=1 Tax=Ruthenibacterium lactatiformans TaxID=1550024 RepID=UPI003A8E311B
MEKKEIESVLKEVNDYLSEQLWMDFEIIQYSKNSLKVIGSIDISDVPTMELIFEDVYFISAPFNWKTDTSKTVISLLHGEEAKRINLKFRVEQGYHIIKIQAEDYPKNFGCLFGVKHIFFRIL